MKSNQKYFLTTLQHHRKGMWNKTVLVAKLGMKSFFPPKIFIRPYSILVFSSKVNSSNL